MNFMVREFEETRKDEEIAQLFSTLELVTDTKEEQINGSMKMLENELERTTISIDKLNNLCNEIIDMEKINEEHRKEEFNEKSKEHNLELSQFINKLQKQIEEIDSFYIKKETELKQFYNDLETKLKI